MIKLAIIAISIALTGNLIAKRKREAAGFPADLEGLDGSPENIRALCADAGLPSDWATFMVAKSYVESRFETYSARGVMPGVPVPPAKLYKNGEYPGDAAAAKSAYDRQIERGVLTSSPWPAERYTFGSYGIMHILPANGIVVSFKDTPYVNIDPWSLFMPSRNIAIATGFNLSLMRNNAYKSHPTWRTVYAGWGGTGRMSRRGDPDYEAARGRFRKGLNAAGVTNPDAYMESKPSPATSAVQVLKAIGRL